MPTLRLTQVAIKSIPRPDGAKQKLYFDAEPKGFGVLVSGKTDTRTFIVQRSLLGGKTRRISIGRVGVFSVEEARAKARKIIAKFYDGCDPKEEQQRITREQKATEEKRQAADKELSLTLRCALDQYLKNARLKPDGERSSRAFVENNLTDWLDLPLRNITRDMVIDRHRLITEEVVARAKKNPLVNGHGISNLTIRTLRAIYYDARIRFSALPENPVREFKRVWHPETRRTTYVKPSDLPKFYAAAEKLTNPVHRHYVQFVLFTGLRRTEAAALSWAEVDFDERVIRLPASRTKAARALDLPMSDFVHDLLQARQKDGREGKFVFPSPTSRSGHIEEPKFALDQIAEISGVQVSCHDLRRTFITVASSCGISPFALKGLVNHSYGSDVTAGYIVSNHESLREPMQAVTTKLLTLIGGKHGETK